MTDTDVESAILTFIADRFTTPPGVEEVAITTPLVETGIVDSVGILLIVRFVEEEFGVRVEADDLVLENFATVEAVRDFVTSRLA